MDEPTSIVAVSAAVPVFGEAAAVGATVGALTGGAAKVKVTATPQATPSTIVSSLKVCARIASGAAWDFPAVQNTVVTTAGTPYASSQSLASGTYTVFACAEQTNGVWWNGPVATVTVPTAAPVTFYETADSIKVGAAGSGSASPFAGANRYGLAMGSQIQYASAAEQTRELADIQSTGAKWIRFDLKWNEIQNAGPGTYDWSRYDPLYHAAAARGLHVLVTIVGAPPWARNAACASSGDTCAPSDPALFGTFAQAAAAHYAPMGVHAWELWNEPNLTTFWKPAPDPAAYTALLAKGYAGVKAADPTATVLSAGLAAVGSDSGNVNPPDFLSAMYGAGAQGSFDALADHPYCWGQPTCPNTAAQLDTGSGWSEMADTAISLRSLMVSHGDGAKAIWATEFGAPTAGGANAKSEAQQATMLTQAYNLFASYAWSGPLFWYAYQDVGASSTDTESWFGLTRPDGSDKPAYSAFTTSIANAGPRAVATTVALSTTVAASARTTARSYRLCVRSTADVAYDLGASTNILITVTGTKIRGSVSLPAGSYRVFACITTADGSSWAGPARAFSVPTAAGGPRAQQNPGRRPRYSHSARVAPSSSNGVWPLSSSSVEIPDPVVSSVR